MPHTFDSVKSEETRRVTTWLPLALCLVLTAAASVFVGRAERGARRARVETEMESVRAHIEERIATYVGVLRGAAGLASSATPVREEELRAFIARLNLRTNYPGTQGIGYSVRLGAIPVTEATARAQAAGWNIRVWPETPRDDVHAIVLLEPRDARNQAALGYDMRSEPTRREAMDRARDEGDVAMSSKVTLVQEIDARKQAGFLLYAPVYAGGDVPATVDERRAKLAGYVYMPLRAGDLFAGIFGKGRPALAYEIYDGTSTDPARRLFASGGTIERRAGATRVTLPIASHTWTLEFVPADHLAPAFVLTAEVAAFGLLLCAVLFFVTRARERARDREVRATAAALASEETARVREMFVAILGHDLLNPINAIVLNLEQLSRKLADDSTALALIQRVRASTNRMTRMIDQMLDLTRARLGGGFTLDASATDLGVIARDVIDEIVTANAGCHVEIDAAGSLDGEWDGDRLAQVFSNLVGNAVRHRLDAPVHVHLDGSAPDRVRVEVHNAGAIPPTLLPAIFEPFRGTGPRARGTAGLGLGLFITREIVVAHGGSIDVVSDGAHGTTFAVTLPRHGVRAAASFARTPRQLRATA